MPFVSVSPGVVPGHESSGEIRSALWHKRYVYRQSPSGSPFCPRSDLTKEEILGFHQHHLDAARQRLKTWVGHQYRIHTFVHFTAFDALIVITFNFISYIPVTLEKGTAAVEEAAAVAFSDMNEYFVLFNRNYRLSTSSLKHKPVASLIYHLAVTDSP